MFETPDGEAIMREWRGLVPRELADDYERILEATGLPDYASTPGNLGVWLLRDDKPDGRPGLTEFTTLTLWTSFEAIRSFAGEDVSRARYYTDDDAYLVDRPDDVRHYRVRFRADGRRLSAS